LTGLGFLGLMRLAIPRPTTGSKEAITTRIPTKVNSESTVDLLQGFFLSGEK